MRIITLVIFIVFGSMVPSNVEARRISFSFGVGLTGFGSLQNVVDGQRSQMQKYALAFELETSFRWTERFSTSIRLGVKILEVSIIRNRDVTFGILTSYGDVSALFHIYLEKLFLRVGLGFNSPIVIPDNNNVLRIYETGTTFSPSVILGLNYTFLKRLYIDATLEIIFLWVLNDKESMLPCLRGRLIFGVRF